MDFDEILCMQYSQTCKLRDHPKDPGEVIS